ncbi:MAG: glycosyltransferase family 2 protein [Pseudomonadota bacterium]
MPNVCVVIVHYHAGDRLARCLEALSKQTYNDFNVLVVENGSIEENVRQTIATYAQKVGLGVELIDAGSNLGFAAANNLAVAQTQSPWVAFLNPDAYAYPDWLERLIIATGENPQTDAFGSLQIDAIDETRLDGMGDVMHLLGIAYRGGFGWPTDKVLPSGECFAPCAAAALYKRSIFQILGGFDERFFCYGEDVDLGFRLRLAGGHSIQLRDAIVLHEGSGVTGRSSDFTVYHGHRNRIWLAYKNFPSAVYWMMLPFHLLFNGVMFVRSVLNGTVKAYWRAMVDGYGGLPRFTFDRRSLQKARKVSVGSLMKWMAWSPLDLIRRRPRLRPLDHDEGVCAEREAEANREERSSKL